MSPLLIFDARHGWRNALSIKRFFLERQTTISARPWNAIPKFPEVANEMFRRLVGGADVTGTSFLGDIFLFLFFGVFVLLIYFFLLRMKITQKISAYWLLIIWFGTGLVGLSLYKQQIYDHYYGFFFPAPFLLIGGLAQSLINKSRLLGGLFVVLIISYLLCINLRNNPLKYPPNRQLQRSIEVSEKIIGESDGQKFNMAVIAERNYEGAYQYFLENRNALFVAIDPQRADDTITEQLFVVCELSQEKCDPTHNPKAEIANFGWTKIENEWQVAGTTLYKLTHTK
jgi:hypothetical protein